MKSRRNLFRTSCAALSVAALAATLASCGGGGGGSDLFEGVADVMGRAVAPSAGVVDSNPVPLGNGVVAVRDFSRETARVTEVGTTDADGNFSVQIPANGGAVIVMGAINGNPVRIAGLVRAEDQSESKNLDPATDVACQAYLDAFDAGEVGENDLTPERIARLERGALQFLQANQVNFFDPNSVTAAATAVRVATANGAVEADFTPPQADATPTPIPAATPTPDTPSGLNCQSSETTCADGTPICAELFCNGAQDCRDGSDENPAVCGEESSCCTATNGCPGETGTSCAEECCCCPLNQICDQDNFANGCVGARTTGRTGAPHLQKLIDQGSYY